MEEKIKNILTFLKDIELLKSVTRHSWTSSGRHESVAEHSWRMAIMAMAFEKEFPNINISKVIEMVLIHDWGEIYDGDTPAFEKQPENKLELEEKAVRKLVQPLDKEHQEKFINLWKEYNACETQEAKLAKALDKLEVIMQHNEADLSTWIPIEYEFNLNCAREYMEFNEFIKAFRAVLDEQTRKKIGGATSVKK